MTTVGARVRPFNWDALSAGSVSFTADLIDDTMCHVAVVRSPHPHAEVIAVDMDAAAAMPGVVSVLTASDFPSGLTYVHRGGELSDWPPLAVDRVRYVGQEVAAVAARTLEQARAAARRVMVRYQPLRAPMTMTGPASDRRGSLHDRTTGEPNVAVRWSVNWGDVDAGREASTRWVRGGFRYPRTVHACMEPNIVIAHWDPDGESLEMWVSTQAPYFTVKEVAHCLQLPEDRVHCREVAVGGGFGSKSKIQTHEVIAAALARKSGQTVVLRYDRDEEFTANKTRHEFLTELSVGYDEGGALRMFDGDIRANNGAYNHMGPSVLKVGAITLGSMYRPHGVHFDARLVDTAQLPGGPFRGYGTPQVALALESLVDEVARDLGVDPIELRLANLRPGGERAWCGYRVGTSGLDQCLTAAREAAGWDEHRARPQANVGMGVAAGMHGSGSFAYAMANRSDAAVDLTIEDGVRLRFRGADAGTGQRTILAQIVAEELGLAVEDVSIVSMDTETTPFEMGAWSSRGTQMTGHAVGKAARLARDELLSAGARMLESSDVTLRGGCVEAPTGSVKFAEIVAADPACQAGTLTFEVSFVDNTIEMMTSGTDEANLSPSYAFAAHIAKVEVDPLIGRVKLLDYVAAHDLGRPINPTLAEGQIIGGAVMGIGAALGEELLLEHGQVVNGAYINYALPRSADVPAIRALIVDVDEPAGPYGAKSVGEMSLIPAAPAVANAVADAIGVRVFDLPITPDKVIAAVARRDGRTRSFRLWRRPRRWWIAVMRWLYGHGLHKALETVRDRVAAPLRTAYALGTVEQPASLSQALGQLASGARPLGGGTDLALQARQGIGEPTPLVATSTLTELRGTELADDWWTFGAATTLAELADMVRSQLPGLSDCVERIASPQVRNVATLAGNLVQEKRCWFFRNGFACYKRAGATAPCYAVNGDHRFYHAAIDAHRCQAVTPSDLATALFALDAELLLVSSAGQRRIPIADFYNGPGETVLGPTELVTEIRFVTPRPGDRLLFEKVNLYDGDFALVSAAVRVSGQRRPSQPLARCVLGGIAPVPIRLASVEAVLAEGGSAKNCRAAADRELDRRAHPLPGNAWKVDAAAGLVERLARQLHEDPVTP